jgi:hypothetical protein
MLPARLGESQAATLAASRNVFGESGRIRTYNLRVWRPLLCQLSYRDVMWSREGESNSAFFSLEGCCPPLGLVSLRGWKGRPELHRVVWGCNPAPSCPAPPLLGFLLLHLAANRRRSACRLAWRCWLFLGLSYWTHVRHSFLRNGRPRGNRTLTEWLKATCSTVELAACVWWRTSESHRSGYQLSKLIRVPSPFPKAW